MRRNEAHWTKLLWKTGLSSSTSGLRRIFPISATDEQWKTISDKMRTLCTVTDLALPEGYDMQWDKYGGFTSASRLET